MSNQLAVQHSMTIDETIQIGKILAQSGFFNDTREAAQAVAKILAGQEIGFGPMAAMTGIHIVKGKVTLSANLLAAAVKRSGKYDYIVRQINDTMCKLAFVELRGDAPVELGESTFTIEDAEQAGLVNGDNWKKYKRNMLFARAMSNGQKWYCPDILGGPLYTPDEFGLAVDEDGEVARRPITRPVPEDGYTTGEPQKAIVQEIKVQRQWPDRPLDAETVREYMNYRAAKGGTNPPTIENFRRMHAALSTLIADDDDRHLVQRYFFGVNSSKELNAGQVEALRAWPGIALDEETGAWVPSGYSAQELRAVLKAARIEAGQTEMFDQEEQDDTNTGN